MKAYPLLALAPLFLPGCFLSSDEDPPRRAQVAPGMYVGDYSWIDTSERNTVETEFSLESRGNYRILTLLDNEALFGTRGLWRQEADAFRLGEIQATVDGSQPFFEWKNLKGGEEFDTTALRDVTDTSFVRKEYTIFRQKPYWITYTRRIHDAIPLGRYRFDFTYRIDTLTVQARYEIALKPEGGFSLREFKDTVAVFEVEAEWKQAGSFLAIQEYRYRQFADSLRGFPAKWDSVPGDYFWRVQGISDTAIDLWSPGSLFSRGHWDSYQKIP
jgi:hypothetical protein